MLSYRHSFHAGNPADVIKHLVLIETLTYLTQKDKPLEYIDTHSGVGIYRLANADAQKTQEYLDGIAKLWQYTGDNQAIANYVERVKQFNKGELEFYPGSPLVADSLLRDSDKRWLFELHPQDSESLKNNMAELSTRRKQTYVRKENGFSGLLGLLPPQAKRGCVLIDPPYEIKSDYEQVVKTVKKANARFNSGTIMIWYPVVTRERIEKMEQGLIASGVRNIQLFELATSADSDELGMTASGMIVINPPWTLKKTMDACLPELVSLLSDDGGFYRSEQLVEE
ncbi:23S rRNA (adenine(2030)-N(6))-methyltransferase RlmJ [Pseudoalteromonas sp. MMG024]|uniref:23S rRNA (adenine(2030)-N(6))-methyltransferase RlmJ n=1 Tax=Pseudoalteromonas sp. MMG024 TaxID=2909980 RepID=UPI001F031BB7|nr:23S rRNA (adenine(2030)-N(6))-methyltransferase RlmJ [Pseudoalteromonas sp. MMG024]MCF6458517.1 23S rRNA (adenine(2030)-N(6))-methyltransferase RlmJ [Pseudoalteromonas sp. MMG024]